MNLLERLEVIAADYYTKAMAIRTTIHILHDMGEGKAESKVKKGKVKHKRKYKMSAAARKAISSRMKAYWNNRRGNKGNKRGRKESGK